ncbi:HAD family hydrolase [Pseudonocardia spinosispora]|uniref:HAD family hydrolase n=1 Tax=Pseudonocardia spinosispora TaxID=103441 RepID=UPI00048A58BD|nr:HAD-IA family hydrolase [Pseudonocardia spinosispora]
MTFRGAIFDVDGVLVDSPHEPAWRDSLRELMEGDWSDIVGDTSWTPDGFTSQVYQQVLSGKPRMDGARDALEHFGVPDVERRAKVYADRKQAKVVALIEAGKFKAYPDAVRFVLAVEAAGIPTAAASSSKNAGMLLQRIELDEFGRPGEVLLDVFDADVSGRNFAHGKPAPDIFLAAAQELGAAPADCFVVEDAPNGIQAAKAGGMAGLGVARADDADLLADKHADLVVTSLDQVVVADLAKGRLTDS